MITRWLTHTHSDHNLPLALSPTRCAVTFDTLLTHMEKTNLGAIALLALVAAGWYRCTAPDEAGREALRIVNASAQQCDPNYSGCVPIASDVDCAGGGGNGPEYVRGPVKVIGGDIYRLDGDGDGVACE